MGMKYPASAGGRPKFDRRSKYSVYGALGIGVTIASSWKNIGLGTGDAPSQP